MALPSELDAVRREVRVVGQPVELAQHKVSIGYRKGEKVYHVLRGEHRSHLILPIDP